MSVAWRVSCPKHPEKFWFLFAETVEEAFLEGSRDVGCDCDEETYITRRAEMWDGFAWRPFPTSVLLRLGVEFTCMNSECLHPIARGVCTMGCGRPVSFDRQDIGTTDEDHYERSAYCCAACHGAVSFT